MIEILRDCEQGFGEVGEHLKSPELKAFVPEEASRRRSFAKELEAELVDHSRNAEDISGTTVGTLHRPWGDLKANPGGGDRTFLETAEQGENAAKKAYKEALEGQIQSPELRETLRHQRSHIQSSHDKVKAFRDSLAVTKQLTLSNEHTDTNSVDIFVLEQTVSVRPQAAYPAVQFDACKSMRPPVLRTKRRT